MVVMCSNVKRFKDYGYLCSALYIVYCSILYSFTDFAHLVWFSKGNHWVKEKSCKGSKSVQLNVFENRFNRGFLFCICFLFFNLYAQRSIIWLSIQRFARPHGVIFVNWMMHYWRLGCFWFPLMSNPRSVLVVFVVFFYEWTFDDNPHVEAC